MSQVKTYVIVGGVAGGASAAARLRRLDATARIVICERGPYASFANCGLPYHVAGVIAERDRLLVTPPERLRERLGIDLRLRHEVTAINRAQRQLTVHDLEGGQHYQLGYDALILSPGAAPLRPPLPGFDDPRVMTLRTIPDMDAIVAAISAGQHQWAVIGGGYIGLEMAEALRQRDVAVTLIERLPQVMGPMDPEMVQPVHAELRRHGVDLRLGRSVSRIEGDSDNLHLHLDDHQVVTVDAAVLAIGVRPETALATAAGLAIGERGGIVVDEQMRTDDPHIWAVGDAVEVRDPLTGTSGLVPLAGPANRQGRIAADAICGRPSRYRGTLGTAVCKICDLTVAMTGLSEKAATARAVPCVKVYVHPLDHAGYYPGACPLTIKLLFAPDSGRVLGAQAVGPAGVDKRIDVIATAIAGGMTVDDLAELELCYAPPYGSAKDPVNMAGFVAQNVLHGDIALFQPDAVNRLGPDQVFLNVATAAELRRIDLPGQIHIPIDELAQRLEELPRDRELIAVCASGLRSYLACRLLGQHGLRCRNLNGGMTMVERHRDPAAEAAATPAGQGSGSCGCAPSSAPVQEVRIDACGLQCPGPIMRLATAVNQAAPGTAIVVTATDPAFAADVAAWCSSTGHELLAVEPGAAGSTARIKVASGQAPAAALDSAPGGGLSVVVFANDLDRAIAAFIIANGAASMGLPVTMFFTFWGINVLRRHERVAVRKNLIERMFGWMMPRGARRLALSKMHMLGIGAAMIRGIMRKHGVASLPELISSAQAAGVRMVVCTMSMDLMGFKREELIDGLDEGGVATYLDTARTGRINLFI